LFINFIKSVLWRVAKRLSYTEDARCLKVNFQTTGKFCDVDVDNINRNAFNPAKILRFKFRLFHKTDGLEFSRPWNSFKTTRCTEISNELLICLAC